MSNQTGLSLSLRIVCFLCVVQQNCSTFGGSDNGIILNYHRTISVGGPVGQIVSPSNGVDFATSVQSIEYLTGLNELRSILATTTGRIRAYGSRWSYSNVFYTKATLVDTRGLNYARVGLDANFVLPTAQHLREQFVVVQAGVAVRHLNQLLFENDLSLSTSGSGDGQRLVGAVSTDTHGSHIEVGTMSSLVRAIHVLLGPEKREVVIQRESLFTNELASGFFDGAELITDGSLFRATVVGVGSLGLIHAMIIEAVPLFLLERQTKPLRVRQFKELVTSDFSTLADLGFEGYENGALPQGLWVRFNPFSYRDRDKSMVMILYREVEDDQLSFRDSKIDYIEGSMAEFRGVLLLANPILSLLLSASNVVHRTVMKVISGVAVLALTPPTQFGKKVIGYHKDFFGGTGELPEMDPIPIASIDTEVTVSSDNLLDALEVMTSELHRCPFTVRYFLIRLTAPVDALLSPSVFSPLTAHISMPSQYQRYLFTRTGPCIDQILRALAESGIPHRAHMGKYIPESAATFRTVWGGETIDAWKAEREKLLDTDVLRDRFANDWLETVGLTS